MPETIQCRARPAVGWPVVLVWLVAATCVSGPAFDTTHYIGLDEIQPDMVGYCLTVYRGQAVEKFGLRVLNVVRNWQPGRDAILVVGTDERFLHTGTVAGCSGSPVYLDGRMAGALAAGWYGSKDPLYLVTPIGDMLQIGMGPAKPPSDQAVSLDYTGPIDLTATDEAFRRQVARYLRQNAGSHRLLPLVTSLPEHALDAAGEQFEAMGLVPIAAGQTTTTAPTRSSFEPGGVLTMPLLSGDMSMAVTGTVTEVANDKVYGFGHSFGGIGPVDLPMAGGTVHTVVPGLLRAFKFSSPGPIVGAIRYDEAMGVVGIPGARPKLIDLTIRVTRYNDPQQRTYHCRMAVDKLRTPLICQSALVGAVEMYGDLPPEHTLRYRGSLVVDGLPTLHFNNVSSGVSYGDLATDVGGAVEKVMLNPFAKPNIRSLDVAIEVEEGNAQAAIKSVQVSDAVLEPGQTLRIEVLLQSYMAQKTHATLELALPQDLKPGVHAVQIFGAAGYIKHISTVAPHRLTGYDLPSLNQALQNLLSIRRDRLYAILTLPSAGLTVQQNELPDLPAIHSLVLQGATRLEPYTRPMQHWIVAEQATGRIVLGQQALKITVEKP